MAEQQPQVSMEELQKKIQEAMATAQDAVHQELKQFQAHQPPSTATSVDQASLLELITQFNKADTQVALLNLLVESVAPYVPRTMLLIRKGSSVHGWAGRGFTAEFVAKQLKRVKWPIESYSEISQVIQSGKRLITSFSELSDISDHISAFDGFVPLKSCFFPIQVKNKIAAILYCDTGSTSRLENQDLVEILTRVAGAELTLVTSKIKKPGSQKVTQEETPTQEPEPEPTFSEKVAEPEPVVETELPPAQPEPQFGDLPAQPSGFGEGESQFDADQGMPSFATQAIETQAIETQAIEEKPAPSLNLGNAEEDPNVKKARRVARVLVSDLKLYNETTVETGCRNKDLYQRLQDDIDRSYKHYQERIATLLSDHSINYFKEELINQSADGDASKLGPLPY